MKSKTVRMAVLVGLLGTVLEGGCLGSGWWRQALISAAVYTGLEFVTDNDSVFDLFQDGPPAA